jgi:hypothetical protein
MCASSCSKNAKLAYSQPPKLNQSQVSRKSESYKGEHRHCSRSEFRRTNNSEETQCCGCTDKQAINTHHSNHEEHLIELFLHQIGDFQSNRKTKIGDSLACSAGDEAESGEGSARTVEATSGAPSARRRPARARRWKPDRARTHCRRRRTESKGRKWW